VNALLVSLAGYFVNKKNIVKWIGIGALTVGASVAGMNSDEFKESFCGGNAIKLEGK
jgi:hypothetical protein